MNAGSINIFNGNVGLTFSCYSQHYLPYNESIQKGIDFWHSNQSGMACPNGQD